MKEDQGNVNGQEQVPVVYRQEIHAGPGSEVYAVLHGDMHIRNGHPVYRFEPFPIKSAPIDIGRVRRQPSKLLAAENQIVAFSGRNAEMTELTAWRDDPAPGMSVLLMHGRGGQGKSRLAKEFAVDSAERSWKVWAGHHVSDPTASTVVVPGDTGQALLTIVEYADRWPADDLQLLLQNPLLRRPERTRVLLVARLAESWWPALRHRLGKAHITVGGTIALQPLARTPAERHAVFDAARDAFCRVFEIPAATVNAGRLTGHGFELVLTLHMAALVAVDAWVRNGAAPDDPVGLSAYLLDREHDYWQSSYDHDAWFVTAPGTMARTVHVATLTRAQPRASATAALRMAGVARGRAAAQAIDDHAACYPPQAAGQVLEPLYPDRLGEDFIALRTVGHTVPGYAPDRWSTTTVARLLSAKPAGSPARPWIRSGIAIFVEAAARWPHLAAGQLWPMLRSEPGLALAGGGATLARLAGIAGITLSALEAIETMFPPGRDIDLDPGIAAVTELLTERRVMATDDPRQRAPLYAVLGERLSNAGRPDDAVSAYQRAIENWWQVIATDPELAQPMLAACLNNISICLSDMGRGRESCQAAVQAVEIYQRLAPALPAIGADLAAALATLATALAGIGQRKQALEASTESVRIRRDLAVADDPASAPRLATTLMTHSIRLWQAGRRAAAVAAATEAATIQRGLSAREPARFMPELGATLTNLGVQLSSLGRRTNALDVAREAAQIHRHLDKINPQAFGSRLGSALIHLAIACGDSGRYAEAVTTGEEAVFVCRRLADENPQAFAPLLAGALTNHCAILAAAGERDGALTAAQHAEALYRDLSDANPSAFLPLLAACLTNLSAVARAAGQRGRAREAAQEAVGSYRKLTAAEPGTHAQELAAALANLATALGDEGLLAEAAEIGTEAAAAFRGLTAIDPAAHRHELAVCLANLGARYAEIGRGVEAAEVTAEAVAIQRDLAAAEPTAFLPDLARSLSALSAHLSRLNRGDEAATAAAEAVTASRRLAADDDALFAPTLAAALMNLGIVGWRLGDRTAALAATTDAAQIWRRLAAADVAAFSDQLAACLVNLGTQLSELGRHHEAIAAHQEAARTYRAQMQADRGAAADLVDALTSLSTALTRIGRHDEAQVAATEAVAISRELATTEPPGSAHEVRLATSVQNLGVTLADAGRVAEALAAAQEAVAIRRRLAVESPAGHAADLASALNNLGNALSAAQRLDEGIAVGMEAVRIRRGLATARPAAHTADLATSLHNVGIDMSQAGRHAQAAALTGDAVEIVRRLAMDDPVSLRPNLAMVLAGYARVRVRGRIELAEAFAAADEAAEGYAELSQDNPEAFGERLQATRRLCAAALALLSSAGAQDSAMAEPTSTHRTLGD